MTIGVPLRKALRFWPDPRPDVQRDLYAMARVLARPACVGRTSCHAHASPLTNTAQLPNWFLVIG